MRWICSTSFRTAAGIRISLLAYSLRPIKGTGVSWDTIPALYTHQIVFSSPADCCVTKFIIPLANGSFPTLVHQFNSRCEGGMTKLLLVLTAVS
jgi:hypothetical protein